jgi:hypothetical protein
MRNSETEQEHQFIIGAKETPQGTLDLSRAAEYKDSRDIDNERKEFQAVIPRGWTTLKHGTNLIKWGDVNPYTSDTIKIKNPLSVVSQEDAEYSKQHGLSDTTKGYAGMARRPEGMTDDEFEKRNKPFEIRIVFYQNHPRSCADPEYKKGLDKKTMDEIAEYYFANHQGGRHPLVPRGETLIKIGHIEENGTDVFYFVPESVKDAYLKESAADIEKLSK